MERHGFVTFWLIMLLIGSGFGVYYCTMNPEFILPLFNYNKTMAIISNIISIVNFVAIILLLNWSIAGFWIIFGTGVVSVFVLKTTGMNFLGCIVGSFIHILILYGVLKLQKNGVSAWDYLNNNYTKNSPSYTNKKCRQCNTIYSGTSCTNCGSSLYEEVHKPITTRTPPVRINHGDTWVCKECNERNPLTASYCKSCGGYK